MRATKSRLTPLSIDSAVGMKHADTAQSLDDVATLLAWMGAYEQARPSYEHAIAIRTEVLGENHADTANSLEKLGAVLVELGDYAAARRRYEQALAITREDVVKTTSVQVNMNCASGERKNFDINAMITITTGVQSTKPRT